MYEKAQSTVDVVLISLIEDELKVGLTIREKDPFIGKYALPGGFVHVDEDGSTDDTAQRVLKTKINYVPAHLEQLKTFSGISRGDPRGWFISVVYISLVRDVQSKSVQWFSFKEIENLGEGQIAFDHKEIIKEAFERLKSKSQYTHLPAFLLPPTFTLSNLQNIYEKCANKELDKRTFRRFIETLDKFKDTGEVFKEHSGRPAKLFELKD